MLTQATLNHNHDTPYSSEYEDCYYSSHNGLAESRYVFFDGAAIKHSWHHKHCFVIAEMGFGTGLNFVMTWHEWLNSPTKDRPKHLHFISFEQHPISKPALANIHQQWIDNGWHELTLLSRQLLNQYPEPLYGFHQLFFEELSIHLTLCFMPAIEAISMQSATVDAWYLDGFSPAKNPSAWTLELFKAMSDRSNRQATLATFTAASFVRKNLQATGFTISKRKGYGTKREMLIGVIQKPKHTPNNKLAPWYQYPSLCLSTENNQQKEAVIIGGGIAGCQMAWHLAYRGWKVILLEQHEQLSKEASGNKAGVIMPKMTAQMSLGESFYVQSFLYAIQQLRYLSSKGFEFLWEESGLLQLNHNQRELKRWQALLERKLPSNFMTPVNAEQASQLANISITQSASYFPSAAWINPKTLCSALTQHKNIHVNLNVSADSFLQTDQNTWQIKSSKGDKLYETSTLILANGKDAQTVIDNMQITAPLMPIAGQTSEAQVNHSQNLKTVIGHEGYLTPAIAGQHVFGATFERHQTHAVLSDEASKKNYVQLFTHLPDFAKQLHGLKNSHAAVRMASPDRFPYVGGVADESFFKREYADLQQGKHWKTYEPAKYQQGFYLFAGFSSRGLTTTGLCAEMLACLINNEPNPLQIALQEKLHPARFLIKQLKQQKKADK